MLTVQEITREQICKFSEEQFAGLILYFIKHRIARKENFINLEIIKENDISPKWLGKKVENDIEFYEGGGVGTYAGSVPRELKEKLENAVELLREYKLIKTSPGQISQDYIVLTERGEKIYINADFSLLVERSNQELINKYSKAIFLIENKNKGNVNQGTAFLYNNKMLITATHVIKEGEWQVILDLESGLSLPSSNFQIEDLKNDISILYIKGSKEVFQGIISFDRLSNEISIGLDIISFGYPRIPGKNPSLVTVISNIINVPSGYSTNKEEFIIADQLDGGNSGGPIITKKGEILGLVVRNISNSSDSQKIQTNKEYTACMPLSIQ